MDIRRGSWLLEPALQVSRDLAFEYRSADDPQGMSCAYHLSQHPEKFDVTLIDAVDYCGGQAFSIPIDKETHGASWLNQGVQGGSYIFHHTMTMFARQGYHADPVKLQVGQLYPFNCSTKRV